MSSIRDFYQSKKEFIAQGVKLPDYQKTTASSPVWLHIGGGNLYRGFHAKLAQDLLEQQELSTGIVVGETFDKEVIEKIYHGFNNHLLQVVMHENGNLEKNLLNSTIESFFIQPGLKESQGFSNYFKEKNVQLVTLTITEKGYNIRNSKNEFLPVIEQDIANGPQNATHTMSIITALLLERFLAGAQPIAMVSTDNFSRNGERFQQAVLKIAEQWVKNGFVSKEFLCYLSDEQQVSFPWTMIDRITPNPSELVANQLKQIGITDVLIVETSKATQIASFSNTEEVHYLVVEDNFPNGRPHLEKAAVIFTDRATVAKADAMKVTTCLNPLHTALAIFGQLLHYTSIAEEMKNLDLVDLIKGIGYQEGLPVVEDPQIIRPKAFIDEVITKRLPNPMIPDTPQRIATDTSQKLAVRFGETIIKYLQSDNLDVTKLKFIPFTIAGWLRLLIGLDDTGQPFKLSPDPLLKELQEQLAPLKFGSKQVEIHNCVKNILNNPQIFGIDLYQASLGEKIELYLEELLKGHGAVKEALHKLIKENGEQSWT